MLANEKVSKVFKGSLTGSIRAYNTIKSHKRSNDLLPTPRLEVFDINLFEKTHVGPRCIQLRNNFLKKTGVSEAGKQTYLSKNTVITEVKLLKLWKASMPYALLLQIP